MRTLGCVPWVFILRKVVCSYIWHCYCNCPLIFFSPDSNRGRLECCHVWWYSLMGWDWRGWRYITNIVLHIPCGCRKLYPFWHLNVVKTTWSLIRQWQSVSRVVETSTLLVIVARETGAILCRIALWDFFGQETGSKFDTTSTRSKA